jgi:Domain of unknown function (DUF4126)
MDIVGYFTALGLATAAGLNAGSPVSSPAAPATGVVAALAATGGVDVSSPLIVALGLVAAETAHGTRMAIRPFSTVGTAGVGNPVISLIEDVAAIALSLAAILLPVIALLMVLALFGGGWYAIHRVRRMRSVRAAPA